MRSSQKPNRARGRGNRRPNGNNVNRVFESNGPEGKVRGTPQQIIEKYLSLARDSLTADNRVLAESYFQHAEHYLRLLAEAMDTRQERRDGQQPDQQPSQDRPARIETEADGEVAVAARTDGQRRGGSGHTDPRDSEVSGLTTIDSGPADTGNLLVDAEELSASQPRRRPRSHDREPAQSPSPTEAKAPSE